MRARDRVLRGGGWIDSAGYVRAASRYDAHPSYRYPQLRVPVVPRSGCAQQAGVAGPGGPWRAGEQHPRQGSGGTPERSDPSQGCVFGAEGIFEGRVAHA